MAGGRGTRAAAFGGGTPKPLIHVAGTPQVLGVVQLLRRAVPAAITVVGNDDIRAMLEDALALGDPDLDVTDGRGSSPLEDLDLAMQSTDPTDFVLTANGDTALLGLDRVGEQLRAAGDGHIVAWRAPTMDEPFREPWLQPGTELFQNSGLWGGRWMAVHAWIKAARSAGHDKPEGAFADPRLAPSPWHEVGAAYDLGTTQRMSAFAHVGWGT